MENTNILSHKNTGAGLDAMEAMLPHIQTIIKDPEFERYQTTVKSKEKTSVIDLSQQAFTVIASKNRAALYGIVSAVTGKTPEEIDAQPLEETLSVFQGAMGSDVLSFFTFCAVTAARM